MDRGGADEDSCIVLIRLLLMPHFVIGCHPAIAHSVGLGTNSNSFATVEPIYLQQASGFGIGKSEREANKGIARLLRARKHQFKCLETLIQENQRRHLLDASNLSSRRWRSQLGRRAIEFEFQGFILPAPHLADAPNDYQVVLLRLDFQSPNALPEHPA